MMKHLLLALALCLPGFSSAAEPAPDASGPAVLIQTSEGDITLRLYPDKAPLTVANFLEYVDSGFYKGTIFHRVIPNFMIQGGGFLPDMTKKETREPIVNESKNRPAPYPGHGRDGAHQRP